MSMVEVLCRHHSFCRSCSNSLDWYVCNANANTSRDTRCVDSTSVCLTPSEQGTHQKGFKHGVVPPSEPTDCPSKVVGDLPSKMFLIALMTLSSEGKPT